MSSEELSVAVQKLDQMKKRQEEYGMIYLENKPKNDETVAVHLEVLNQMVVSIKIALDQIADEAFDNKKRQKTAKSNRVLSIIPKFNLVFIVVPVCIYLP